MGLNASFRTRVFFCSCLRLNEGSQRQINTFSRGSLFESHRLCLE